MSTQRSVICSECEAHSSQTGTSKMSLGEWLFALVLALLWTGGSLLYQSDRVTENLRPPLSRFDFLHAFLEGGVLALISIFFTSTRQFLHWPLILITIAFLAGGFSLRFLRRKIPSY